MRISHFFSTLLMGAALTACGSSDTTDPTPSGSAGTSAGGTVSFKSDLIPIFSASCGSSACHSPGSTASQLVLLGDLPAVYASITAPTSDIATAPPRVKAGDSAGSFMIHKLKGDFAGLACGKDCLDPMPLAAPALDAGKIKLIADWIDQGAKNN